MNIIKSRTGNKLSRPLRVLSILRSRWDGQRVPALQALADIGHEVVYVDQILNLDGYQKLIRKIKFDVVVLKVAHIIASNSFFRFNIGIRGFYELLDMNL